MACCHCEVTFGHTPEVEGQEDTSLLVPMGTSVPLLTGLFLSPFLDFPGPLSLSGHLGCSQCRRFVFPLAAFSFPSSDVFRGHNLY